MVVEKVKDLLCIPLSLKQSLLITLAMMWKSERKVKNRIINIEK